MNRSLNKEIYEPVFMNEETSLLNEVKTLLKLIDSNFKNLDLLTGWTCMHTSDIAMCFNELI